MDLERDLPTPTSAVLRPRGRLNLVTAADLREVVDSTVAQGHRLVVVDLAETTFLDSSGLGALVGGLRAARAAGGDLRIARPSAQILTVLQLTTMDRVLRPFDTVDEALAA